MAPSSAARRDVVQLHPPARRVAAKAKKVATHGYRFSKALAASLVLGAAACLLAVAVIKATHSREALAAASCCVAGE